MRFLEKAIFYLLILSLPFQLRVQIWASGETFNEYSSAFFYLSDFFVLSLLFVWLWRLGFEKKLKLKANVLFFILLISIFSLLAASNLTLGYYKWLKLLEFILLFIYLKQNFRNLFSFRKMSWLLVWGGIFQATAAAAQFVKQADLGWQKWGESIVGPYLSGTAKFVMGENIVVRSYGLLPHPNILAAFLLLAIFSLYFLYLSKKSYSVFWNIYYGLLYSVLFAGLWFTFSRVIFASFVILSILYFIYVFKKYQPQIRFLILIFLLLGVVFAWLMWPLFLTRASVSMEEQAVEMRLYYNQQALYFISQSPVLGIGIGNYVWQTTQLLPNLKGWFYQPAHNIYRCIMSIKKRCSGNHSDIIFRFINFDIHIHSFLLIKLLIIISV